MHFERANILWNIVGVLTHMGSLEKRTTDESIKSAAKSFQTATGVVGMLKEVLEAHPAAAANLDLTLDCLSLLTNMLYGASQECYFDLAVKGAKMPPDAISKVAFQVSIFFSKALSIAEGALKDSSVPRKWVSYCRLKQQIYAALAYYYAAQERQTSGAYGEQVSRLASAHRILEQCKKDRLDKYIPELTESLNAASVKVASAYALANKDNSTIYFEAVPAESKLPALTGHTMAKATPPEPARLVLNDDPFSKIVPFAVQKADSVYCERRGELLRAVAKQIEDHDVLARTTLADLGLPASLDSMDSTASFDTLQAKITTIQNEGGVSMLKDRSKLLDEIAENDLKLLHQSLAILDAEELEDKNARATHGSTAAGHGGWSRTPSHTLNAHLRQESHKFMANFEQARKSDEFIKSKFAAVANHITKLASLNRDTLMSELPQDAESVEKNALAHELRTRVQQVQHLAAARASLLTQMRQLATEDNILSKLLASTSRDKDQELFEKELSKFDALKEQVTATFATQSQLLRTITEQNATFLASRRVTPAMEQRQAILQTYEGAFQAYTDLKAHLREGAEFYTKFQDLLQKFYTKCSDFAVARKIELQDLVDELKAKLASTASSAQLPMSSPSPSAPAASPHTSNVQIAKPAPMVVNHPSSIYSVPGGYSSASPGPQAQQPTSPAFYYAAAPTQPTQQPTNPTGAYQLPPGFSAQPPPGYTSYQYHPGY
jgi:programmed cell death 6-interacting protein